MAFENTTNREVAANAPVPPRENFGVYVPILLAGRRVLTGKDGVIIRGDRLQGTTDQGNAHVIAGQHKVPTKMVKRIHVADDESRLLNGIVVALKPVFGHTIDLEKVDMEVHDYESLAAMHTDAIESRLPNDPYEPAPTETILATRQLAIVKALASLSLRV